MNKILILAMAVTAVFAQIPKPPKVEKPDLKNMRKVDPAAISDPSKMIPATPEIPKLEVPKAEIPKIDPLTLPMPGSFNIKEATGGPLRMALPDPKKLVPLPPAPTVMNERSTLERKAYILNDEKCPVQIEELGVGPETGKEFRMTMNGQMKAKSAITAVDLRVVSFDLFGNHMSTQQNVLVEDIGKDDLGLIVGPSWSTSEKEMKVLHSTFAFVARVRLADGNVWNFDAMDVARALNKLKLRVEPSKLEPSAR